MGSEPRACSTLGLISSAPATRTGGQEVRGGERGPSRMVLEGQSTGSQGLTKPCADEEPGDTLGVIVLLAPEDLTSHGFLLQLRR